MLAVGVLAAGLTGLIFAIGSVKASSFLADQSTIALNIAQETMEKIIAQRDSNNAGGGYASTLTSIGAGTYNANPVSGFTGYVLTTTVSEKSPNSSGSTSDDFLTTSASSGYARVTVTVSYNGGTNSSVLETLICNY